MKFKDLQIGDKFKVKRGNSGVVYERIKLRHRPVYKFPINTNVCYKGYNRHSSHSGFFTDDTEVEKLDESNVYA